MTISFVLDRSKVPMDKVSVIPNAVDTDVFRPPSPDKRRDKPHSLSNGVSSRKRKSSVVRRITVVIGSRLVYRKGIDLVAVVVPKICQRNFGKTDTEEVKIDFIIAGKGEPQTTDYAKSAAFVLVKREKLASPLRIVYSVRLLSLQNILNVARKLVKVDKQERKYHENADSGIRFNTS